MRENERFFRAAHNTDEIQNEKLMSVWCGAVR